MEQIILQQCEAVQKFLWVRGKFAHKKLHPVRVQSL